MDGFHTVEILRAEALRFANEVFLLTPVVGEADQALEWVRPINDDYRQLSNAVERRFLNRPDGAVGGTHARFTQLVDSYLDDTHIHRRSELHTQVCILFIFHADLFNRFERLRLMNDGRRATRRLIRRWRNAVRDAVMRAIYAVLGDCWSAILRLSTMPETLTDRNRYFIALACFPLGVDPNNQFQADVIANPSNFRDPVLVTLQERQTVFLQLNRFVTHYFNRLDSMHIL